jgi:hypothetical protein
MNDGLAVLVALLLLSAMLCGILTIAGRTLGRARHATTWAIAFGLATLQWAVGIAHALAGGSAEQQRSSWRSVSVSGAAPMNGAAG